MFAIIAQLFEANVLQPRIMKHAIGFSALTTILAMLSGAAIFGLAGAVLAVPIAGTIQVLVQDWIEHRRAVEQDTLQKKILSPQEDNIGVAQGNPDNQDPTG